jgi:CheY-like chemotaxis protein/HPt (histidine-containing phosphotransfer) domain-containing protein
LAKQYPQPGLSFVPSPIDDTQLQHHLCRLFDVADAEARMPELAPSAADDLAAELEVEQSATDSAAAVSGETLARVLLVEDNPVNLVVARRMLAKLGIDSVVARDGLEALDALRNNGVDLVLMDCQMPNMDGYEATKRIRSREQQSAEGAHLPVIAMTANVMAGDREKCLAAGMDDFLGKPLDAASLRRALEPWIDFQRQRGATAEGIATGDKAQPVSAPPLDAHKLGKLRDLMGADLPRLISQFLDTSAQLMQLVDRASIRDDLEGMARPAHSLKSSSANLGALPLSSAAARLEHVCTSGDLVAARAAQRDLQHAFSAAYAALKAELG